MTSSMMSAASPDIRVQPPVVAERPLDAVNISKPELELHDVAQTLRQRHGRRLHLALDAFGIKRHQRSDDSSRRDKECARHSRSGATGPVRARYGAMIQTTIANSADSARTT